MEILKEIRTRLKFLLDVGLDYLALNRSLLVFLVVRVSVSAWLHRLVLQLVNVLYILDEPSIGLHQRDNLRLINSLKELRDMGNSVIVVEHDKDMMLAADYVIDMGPKKPDVRRRSRFRRNPAGDAEYRYNDFCNI